MTEVNTKRFTAYSVAADSVINVARPAALEYLRRLNPRTTEQERSMLSRRFRSTTDPQRIYWVCVFDVTAASIQTAIDLEQELATGQQVFVGSPDQIANQPGIDAIDWRLVVDTRQRATRYPESEMFQALQIEEVP